MGRLRRHRRYAEKFLTAETQSHLVSVSAVYDRPSQCQFTPVVEIRHGDARTTILTHHAFITEEMATEFGFGLGREWVDKWLAEI